MAVNRVVFKKYAILSSEFVAGNAKLTDVRVGESVILSDKGYTFYRKTSTVGCPLSDFVEETPNEIRSDVYIDGGTF